MTDQLTGIELPRPAPAADPGPLDERLYDLVETRVRRLLVDNPILATYLGIHTEDARLGDASHDAVVDEIAADRTHLAAVEALDDAGLSPSARFERDLELHNLRLHLYEADEIRRWERRSTVAGELGDAVFMLFARGAAPLAERLARIADRLEVAPAFLLQASNPGRRQAGRDLAADGGPVRHRPAVAVRRGPRRGRGRHRRRPSSRGSSGAIAGANVALEAHGAWVAETIADASDDWPLGAERYDELGAAARVRGPRRRRDPPDRQRPAPGQPRGPAGRRPGARARRRPAQRDRAPEDRRPGHLRRGARRLPRRHGPRPRLPDRARPGDDPGRRADRGHRHPRVPARR